jgi:hypothetical protein
VDDTPVINKRVEQYIALRDKIREIKARHEEELKPLNDLLMRLNGAILDHLNTHGGDSITVRGVGTAYRTTKDSASIADGDEFKRWIIGGNLWEMVDWRANSAQVREYIEKNGSPPPGVNFRSVAVVGVRRAS